MELGIFSPQISQSVFVYRSFFRREFAAIPSAESENGGDGIVDNKYPAVFGN